MTTNETVRIEAAESASRCRNFNARGHQCGNYTRRIIVLVRPGLPDYRTPDCGKH